MYNGLSQVYCIISEGIMHSMQKVDKSNFMFFFCLTFAMPLCAFFYMCLVVTCWERADLLALVCGV